MSEISRRGFIKGALALGALPLTGQASSQKEETLKFIHVTDSHMDLSDSDSVDSMKLMADFINENYKDLDFVMFGGDNFNNNVKGNKDAEVFKEIIETLHCPSLVVRGNKESSPKPKDGIYEETFKTMFVNGKGLQVNKNDWLLDIKGFNILGLDSCIKDANNGLYTEHTMAFAEKALQNRKPTVVLNHHPYTNYWGGTEAKDIHKYVLNNSEEVQKRLFRYHNLILTLSGHKHIDSVKELDHTKMVVTRGFVRPLDLDMYPMRYVEITGNKISEKLIYTS
ncbi:metallophosphoesterase [Sulfurimonas sp. SAG-AH-194-C21]|nr:metallophosphoesterase [Sulfurimonas sp. SAG-AH-194-C21]MDF1883593.1 metallophosphoesterase [Sulfurimonas sp. SAG-AH-194-C21]